MKSSSFRRTTGATPIPGPQDALDLRRLDLDAEVALHFRATQRDGRAFDLARDSINALADEFSAGGFKNQLGHAIARQRA